MLPLIFIKQYQNCTTKFDYNTQIKEGFKNEIQIYQNSFSYTFFQYIP